MIYFRPKQSAHKARDGYKKEKKCLFFQCINLYLYTGNDIKFVGAKFSN